MMSCNKSSKLCWECLNDKPSKRSLTPVFFALAPGELVFVIDGSEKDAPSCRLMAARFASSSSKLRTSASDAMSIACNPFTFRASTRARPSKRLMVANLSPQDTASINAVSPLRSESFTSALISINGAINAACLQQTACAKGALPVEPPSVNACERESGGSPTSVRTPGRPRAVTSSNKPIGLGAMPPPPSVPEEAAPSAFPWGVPEAPRPPRRFFAGPCGRARAPGGARPRKTRPVAGPSP
mmetsp:Transcript_115646/g.334094  ORF Transcript_115646/g.334094 Transcript_115646/m.334094 type:complete len:242 (+) Transcript_115646:271-996(+)